ncbi:hypothetical protein [Parapedobacter sp. 10938]|uniref:hypothetical protein n=1 Tax=Parapedobacter flavus TaxID=3110225 RepID=UPI002DBFB5CF|nr:hypothetical protein [Parapedobacter sp. 10938]MEC3879491.1 hypothetical protein [Parapedobacter sp. 10938]
MNDTHQHTFHIPVMGLGFTIDTPLKVARFGISSALSLADDHLVEQMREFYATQFGQPFTRISQKAEDGRAKRITAYLDLLQDIIDAQMEQLCTNAFEANSELDRYFELLPERSPAKRDYLAMCASNGDQRAKLAVKLRATVTAGAVDVNIMTKVDKTNYAPDGTALPPEYSDALAALRGFAQSKLRSSVILSAGLNPRLYSYFEQFDDFFPASDGALAKRITLKVSDYRSALIQGKLLAKKGLWVSEFRIESGLNCGGHAFVSDGMLLGPIMEAFKTQREGLYAELKSLCDAALGRKQRLGFQTDPVQRITVQGGIGTAGEDRFLLDYYQLDGTGWGSPFLLVPEATNVDSDTLGKLANAAPGDFYLSDASPLGVPFHNFRPSSSEEQRKQRVVRNRPGSPCHKKFLSFNTEFTDKPICTASRQYQHLKLKEARMKFPDEQAYQKAAAAIVEKDCLCEGLAAPAVLTNGIPPKHNLKAVTICPGPNLAYFSQITSLKEMVGHIYGTANLLNGRFRSNLFVNELRLYIDYLKKEIEKYQHDFTEKRSTHYQAFRDNLLGGIAYYRSIMPAMQHYAQTNIDDMKSAMAAAEKTLLQLVFSAKKPMVQPT